MEECAAYILRVTQKNSILRVKKLNLSPFTPKMEKHIPPKRGLTSSRLHYGKYQTTVTFIVTAVRISNLTEVTLPLCLIKYHAIRRYLGMDVQLHAFLT
jgi:hypothetical protein